MTIEEDETSHLRLSAVVNSHAFDTDLVVEVSGLGLQTQATMLPSQNEISHVLVRLLLRRDAKTI